MTNLVGHWSMKAVSVLLAGLMTIGCGSGTAFTSGAGKKYVYTYQLVLPAPDRLLVFEDERIAVNFTIDEAALSFRLQNKTDRIVRILWDGVVLGLDGRFDRIRHATDLYTDSLDTRSFPLPARGFIRDLVMPHQHIAYDGTSWKEEPLFRTIDERSDSLRSLILGNVGKRIRLRMPLAFSDGTVDYEFAFEVSEVRSVPWRDWTSMPRDPGPPAGSKSLSKQERTVTIALIVGFLAMFALLISADKEPPSE